jgi:UDP-N-acetylglucosamine 2-epimerase
MKKILTIIGVRPQFIKCAPVSRILRKKFNEVIVHTGQHYDENMSNIFFEKLNIPAPDYNLNAGSGSHSKMTAFILEKLEQVIISEKPDLLLVYGDTNSTLAGALSGSKLQIPVSHIEAGLRSFNKQMPEEINRIVADHCSEILFCPTKTAVNNLKREGITKNVHLTGDVMKDSIINNFKKIDSEKLKRKFNFDNGIFYYVTIHRQENTDNLKNLDNIIDILNGLKYPCIFPVHPRTLKIIKQNNLKLYNHIKIVSPVDYLESLWLQKNAKITLTDSGGIQKESYISGTPCITFRNETEWVETVNDGFNVLVGTDKQKFNLAEKKLLSRTNYSKNSNRHYGNGDAAKKIVSVLIEYYGK